jgi:sulfur-oxidizing protein SoxZ
MTRRDVLVWLAAAWPAMVCAQGVQRAAFAAASLDDALKSLGWARPVKSPLVTLQAQDSEDGSQVELSLAWTAPGVQRVALLVEKNPAPLAAVFEVGDAMEPALRTRVKMAQSSHVHVIAQTADGKLLQAVQDVRVTLGGCASTPDLTMQPSGPTKIRARAQGDRAAVTLLAMHQMESGQRRDAAGKAVPAWYIQDFALRHNGKPVLTAQWGTAMAKNPFLAVAVRGARVGDRIGVGWKDNRGETRADEVAVV